MYTPGGKAFEAEGRVVKGILWGGGICFCFVRIKRDSITVAIEKIDKGREMAC